MIHTKLNNSSVTERCWYKMDIQTYWLAVTLLYLYLINCHISAEAAIKFLNLDQR